MSALDEEDRRHIMGQAPAPPVDNEMEAVLAALPEEERLVL